MTIRVAGRLAAVSLIALGAAAIATPAAAGEKIANAYICVFKKDAVAGDKVNERANAAARAHGGAVTHTYRNALRGFSANISAQGVAALRRAHPTIAYCEQDQVARIVQRGKPGGGPATEQVPYGVTRVNGGATAGAGRAFVIDSGIDAEHPDLTIDAGASRNFAKGNGWDDGNGHGTHVAGTIAAKKNGVGVVGVAPGSTLVAVRVLGNNGSGSYSDVIAGVDYVAAVGRSGDVANMSLGGGFSQAVNDAVVAASAQVKFTLAAGNESTDAGAKSPASANGTNVYTVSAVDANDRWASFSNYGNPPVDYAEPGVGILSTYKGGGYATLSGTSMAAPHLAGILLLGAVKAEGIANNDPDGNPDPIGVH